jgi:hypothetical protein
VKFVHLTAIVKFGHLVENYGFGVTFGVLLVKFGVDLVKLGMKFGHLMAISEIWRYLRKLQKNGVKILAENLRKILWKIWSFDDN